MCVLPFVAVTVVMFFCVISVVILSLLLVAGSGVVLKLSVEVSIDFTVLACNVDALPTGGAEELPVRGVGWLVYLGCKVVRVAFGFTVLASK